MDDERAVLLLRVLREHRALASVEQGRRGEGAVGGEAVIRIVM